MTTQPESATDNTTDSATDSTTAARTGTPHGGSYGMTDSGPHGPTDSGPHGPETRRYPGPPTDFRMRRSATDKMLAGVCGGIAEHTDIDPVYIRLAFLVSLFWGGIGIVAYIAAALIMPKPLPSGS